MPTMGRDPSRDPRFAPYRYWGRCQGCRETIGAETEHKWLLARDRPCPHCGRQNW